MFLTRTSVPGDEFEIWLPTQHPTVVRAYF